MAILTRVNCAFALALLPGLALSQSAPDVTIELLEIDPGDAAAVPLDTRVYGRIRYRTDGPVRLVLLPYRNGQPVSDGVYYSGSPDYPAGSGEAMAWFAFSSPQSIDEIRAVANDVFSNVFAEASLKQPVAWRAGAAVPGVAAWVAPLKEKTEAISESQRPDSESGVLALILTQLIFACIPLSVAVQIHALCKLEGGLKRLARVSAFAMAALWIFVIVTGIAGSNISPIWLVFLSPVFVAYLFALLITNSKLHRREYAALAASDM